MKQHPPSWALEPLNLRGQAFAFFANQDSHCQSWGIADGEDRWFLKIGHSPRAAASLRRAAAFHQHVRHPVIVPLCEFHQQEQGVALLYPWSDGEVLYDPANAKHGRSRVAPDSAHARFRRLPLPTVLSVVDQIIDVCRAVAAAGFVSSDFYDGCVMYDFHHNRLSMIDFDEFRPTPFRVEGRTLGSTRFMAPEEFVNSELVDERTTVFHAARMASILLDEGDNDGRFRAGRALQQVVARGQSPQRADRHPTVSEFARAWSTARFQG